MRARLKISRAGVELIKSFEGLRQSATQLPDGRWTIGYGHTFSAREGAVITAEDADALLRFDLLPIVDSLNSLLLVTLNQNQFDALVSFSFNIGIENFQNSEVLKHLNNARLPEAMTALEAWQSTVFNGQTYILPPLVKRRASEKALFLTPVEPEIVAAPVMSPAMIVAPGSVAPVSLSPTPQEPASFESLSAQQQDSLAHAHPSHNAPQGAVATPKPVIVKVADMGPESLDAHSPMPLNAASGEPESQMSHDVRIALERAQHEARERALSMERQRLIDIELERQAALNLAQPQAMASVAHPQPQPLAEDPRLLAMREQEAQRAIDPAQQARQEEDARLAALKAEIERIENERQAVAQKEAEAIAEAQRREAERAELVRLEAERLEHERKEAERQEQERLEQERLALVRQEEARLEAMRLEGERIQAQKLEAQRLEEQRLADLREQDRLRQAELAVVASAQPHGAEVDSRTPEEIKKAEAAALMRFYSPYGSSSLGSPLQAPLGSPVNAPVQDVSKPVEPILESHQNTAPSLAEPPRQAGFSGTVVPLRPNQPIIPETPTPPSMDEDEDDGFVRTPQGLIIETTEPTIKSPSQLVPPAIIAQTAPVQLHAVQSHNGFNSGSAMAAPATFTSPDVVEVPRPRAVAPQAVPYRTPEVASDMAPRPTSSDEPGLSWREKYQRPLPENHASPQIAAASAYASPNIAMEEEGDWSQQERVSMHTEVEHHEHPSLWEMFGSTYVWIILSVLGFAALGGASASLYTMSQPSADRMGNIENFSNFTIGLAVIGLVLMSLSIYMILKRLSGLKD